MLIWMGLLQELNQNNMYKFVFISLVTLSCMSTAQSTKRTFKTFNYKGQQVNYAIQLPENFDQNKTYPVAVGPSDAKSDDDQSFYWRGIKDTNGWILIDFPIYGSGTRSDLVKSFLTYIKGIYQVEGGKFHTVCFSANSAGIFDLVMTIPEEFHSITGMAGNPSTRDQNKLSKLKPVKVQFVVGDRDSYWMRAAKDRHQQLVSAGVDSQIEIIKNGKHVLVDLVGKGVIERMNKLRPS